MDAQPGNWSCVAVMALTMQIGGLELARGCRRVRAVLGIEYERTEKQREATQDFRKNGFFYGKMHKRAAISRMAALFTSQTLVIGRPEKRLYSLSLFPALLFLGGLV